MAQLETARNEWWRRLVAVYGWDPSKQAGREYSPGSLATASPHRARRMDGSLRLLRRMFHLATEKANDSGRTVLDAIPDFELPTRPKLRLDFLREAEMLSLLDELPARLHAFIKFLFYQGLRSGEAEAITWAQLDLNKAIFFPDAERNKTGDSRVKALADHTVEALQKITPKDAKDREQFMLVNKDEHVFDTANYKKLFKRACLKLGFAYLGMAVWAVRCHPEGAGERKTDVQVLPLPNALRIYRNDHAWIPTQRDCIL